AVAVWHFQAEVVVLGVGDHAGVSFGNAAELRLPIAVQNDRVDLILRRRAAGVPAGGARRVESDVAGRAGVVVRIEQGFDGAFADEPSGDRGGDAVARHVGAFLV